MDRLRDEIKSLVGAARDSAQSNLYGVPIGPRAKINQTFDSLIESIYAALERAKEENKQ